MARQPLILGTPTTKDDDKKSQSAPAARGSDPRFSKGVNEVFGDVVGDVNLNLGCGRNLQPGFVNLDRKPGPGIDVVQDLEDPDGFSTWMYGGYDFVLASHVLEHITNLIPLMRNIHRLLRPGGHLGIVCPYATSDDAVEDPTHVRYFTERSWAYFDRRLYEKDGHAGSYDSDVDFIFEVVRVALIPFPGIQSMAIKAAQMGQLGTVDFMKKHQRNVIKEMQVVMKKVEG